MIPESKIGEWVRIEFWDHTTGLKRPVVCQVAGLIKEITPIKIVLAHWTLMDDDTELVENNEEHVTILPQTILKWGMASVQKWIEC